MVRRLHEIEPPKLSLPSDKSNQSEDPTAKESLASEFKKLLERARTGIMGARDEVAALGLALSQAVSVTRQHTEEISQVVKSENCALSAADETASEGTFKVDEFGEESVVKGRSQHVESESTEQGDECAEEFQVDPEELDEETIFLEEDGGEVLLDEEVVFTDLEGPVVQEEVSVAEQTLAAQLVVQQAQSTKTTTDVGESSDVDSQVESESSLQRVVLASSSEEENETVVDEFTDEDLGTQSGPSELSRPKFTTTRVAERSTEDYSSGDEDLDRFLAQYQSESGELATLGEQDSQLRPAFGEPRLGMDFDKTFGAQRRESSTFTPSAMIDGFVPQKDQNRELSMQLTLLRQAFDTLKAQTMGNPDMRSRSASTSVSGVGATAESRPTQNDTAPRAARYLNRAASQRMMERIESAIKEAAKSRDGKTITLRLEPLQLGHVKCDVSLRDGLLQARITPQNQEVVQAVRERSHELQGALRRLGLNVDRVTVQVLSERESGGFASTSGLFDGNSFQENGNNMPGNQRQTPENTFGSKFADVTGSGTSDAVIAPADHWIA